MPPDRKRLKKKLDDLRSQLDRLGYGAEGDKPAKVVSADELRNTLRKRPPMPRRKPPIRQVEPGPAVPPGPLVMGRLPAASPSRPKARKKEAAHVALAETVAGSVADRDAGKFYLVTTRAASIEGAEDLGERFCDQIHEPGSTLRRELARRLPEVGEFDPEQMVFMDIETTGLSCSPLFLIGIMVWHEGDFEVRQFLARHYGEERGVVAEFLAEMDRRSLVVTFNGKSFDYPFIRTRAAVGGLPMGENPAHLDLLHVGRRFWRDKLPNCKLQTIERFLCHRVREGDIPGAEIPEAYHAYVRTDNAYQIVDILEHNMLDLVTLADIMTRFPDVD
ncbi:MAG: ribonuclease H-like domain-containing protein [Victivallales bacterium]|nr:ribonuclease H-like domain-containing protein [Victivallales bacterium]